MPAHQIEHLARIAIHDFDMHACDLIARPLFDTLDRLPLRLRLLEGRRSPATLIWSDLSPAIEERAPIVAFAIGRHGWRGLGMPTLFAVTHHLVRNLLLTLANRITRACGPSFSHRSRRVSMGSTT